MNKFKLEEFTQLQLLYCCCVSWGEDWHYQYFCDQALVDEHDNIRRNWSEYEGRIGEAANLDISEIQELQSTLSSLSDEDKWNFTTAINALVAIG